MSFESTVLVVEDDPFVLRTLCETLARNGYLVQSSRDAESARTFLMADRSIGVLVTDLCLPKASGLELITWATAERPSLKNVLMTGSPDLLDPSHVPLGTRILLKPFGVESILRVLAQLIDAGCPNSRTNPRAQFDYRPAAQN